MNIESGGVAGPAGWPQEGCRCASCARLRATGRRVQPANVRVDGIPLAELPSSPVPGGWEATAVDGRRLLVAGGPGERPEPAPGLVYGAVLLDLCGDPTHLGALRHRGAVGPDTEVHAVYADHRLPSPAELDRRLSWWRSPRRGPYRCLVLGGSRSGKSAEAELRLAAHREVTYLATGPAPTDSDRSWAARVAAHRARRPAWWRTVETTDLAAVLPTLSGAVLVDGLGTWLSARMAAHGAWDDPAPVLPELDALVAVWRSTGAYLVAVSDEVGLSLVPDSPSGRGFRDLLGTLNQRLAAESEEAVLVVAGRTLSL